MNAQNVQLHKHFYFFVVYPVVRNTEKYSETEYLSVL